MILAQYREDSSSSLGRMDISAGIGNVSSSLVPRDNILSLGALSPPLSAKKHAHFAMPETNSNMWTLNVASDADMNPTKKQKTYDNKLTANQSQTVVGAKRSLSGKRSDPRLQFSANVNQNILSEVAIIDNPTSSGLPTGK